MLAEPANAPMNAAFFGIHGDKTERFLKSFLNPQARGILRFTPWKPGRKLPTFSSLAESLSGYQFE